MRATSKLLALALAAALQPAVAGVVKLDFEDFTGIVSIGARYSALGLTFTQNAWGVTANDRDITDICLGSYEFEPRKNGASNCGALVLGENAAGGFDESKNFSFKITSNFGFEKGISFAFAVASGERGAKVDVLDAAGNSLVGANGDLSGKACETGPFCNWSETGDIFFSGLATTIVFTGADQRLMLDDLVLNTAAGPNPPPLPEPASVALALTALGALGWTRKRAAR